MVDKLIHFLKTLNERQTLFHLIGIAFVLRLYAVLMAQGIANDSAAYGFMARDFMTGNIEKALAIPGHPLYPLLISLFSMDTAHVEITGRLISLFFGTFTVIPLYFLIKEAINQKIAIWSTLFYAFHPYLVSYSGMMLTEATYWGMLVLSVYFFWTGLKRVKTWRVGLSGCFLGLAYLTRPEGIGYMVVYIAWIIIDSLKRKRWFKGLLIIGFFISCTLITSFPYLLHIRQETGQWLISKKAATIQSHLLQKNVEQVYSQREIQTTQSDQKGPGFLLMVRNMIYRLPSLIYHYLRAFHFSLWIFLLLGLLAMKQEQVPYKWFLASFILFHLFSLSIFPFHSSIRFSIPVISLSLCWAGSGAMKLNRYLKKREVLYPERVIFFLILVVILSQLPQSLKPERRHRAIQKEVGLWLKQNTHPDAIIMSNSSQEAFYADRKFIMLPEEITRPGMAMESYHEVMRFARANGVQYILVDKHTSMRNQGFMECIQTKDLREVFRKPDRALVIFEVVY
jgi:hypothetical protein